MYESGPKLNYVVIAMVSMGVIILVLLGLLIFDKDECDCSKYINCSEDENTNKNNEDEVKNKDNNDKDIDTTDYISLAKDLYKKGIDAYYSFTNDIENLDENDCIDEYTCNLLDYNKITDPLFTENGKKQLDEHYEFVIKDGKRYAASTGVGSDITYIETSDFVIKYNNENKITFNVTNKYCALEDLPEDIKTCSDIARVVDEFIIVKESNTWKIESIKIPY